MEILSKASLRADLPLWLYLQTEDISSLFMRLQLKNETWNSDMYSQRQLSDGRPRRRHLRPLGTPPLKRQTGGRASTTQRWSEKAEPLVLRLPAFHLIGWHTSFLCFLKVRSMDSRSVRGPAARSLAPSSHCTVWPCCGCASSPAFDNVILNN